MKKILMMSTLVMAMSGIASANLMVSLTSGPTGTGPFTWTYTATLQSVSALNTGDFFTIYDIGGFNGLSTVVMPANWTKTVKLLGDNGFSQTPADSGSINNVVFAYTGSGVNAPGPSDVGLGDFIITSTTSSSFQGAFSATTHTNPTGTQLGNTGILTVAGTAIPEPSTSLLLGAGLLALSFFFKRRLTA